LGIVADMHQQTSVNGIYAAGDCAVTRSVIDGKPIPAKLATSAYRQGCIAAYGLAGMQKEYRGSAGTFVTAIAGLEIAGTGFTTETARERGFDPVISKINSHIRPDYFLSNRSITVKIIADRNTGKILGAQCIGTSGAAERINIISCAIALDIGLDRFEDIELAYCPAVSEVYDPLMRAAEGAQRRITR